MAVRLDAWYTFVRGGVDREAIKFTRCLMPQLSPDESAASFALRAWKQLVAMAPPSALAGHKILFVTKATTALVVAAALEAKGVSATAYVTNGMTYDERAESEAEWRGYSTVVLVASSAFGQGINLSSVSLVAHVGLAQDPLDYFQQVGRTALTCLPTKVFRLLTIPYCHICFSPYHQHLPYQPLAIPATRALPYPLPLP